MVRVLWMVMAASVCVSNSVEAQNSVIRWWAFGGGAEAGSSGGKTIRSALGQALVGRGQAGADQVNSGFYADTLRAEMVVSVPRDLDGARPYALYQNYPNPFNPSTTIRYSLSRGELVHLLLYNVLGEKVAVLVNELQEAGEHELRLDASRLASGTYFLRLQAGSFSEVRKLVVMR